MPNVKPTPLTLTSARGQIIFDKGMYDLNTRIMAINDESGAKEFMIKFANIIEATASLNENRLLHGDIKMPNAVLATDGNFKFIDLAGITSWEAADVASGKFKLALNYITDAGYEVNPLISSLIGYLLPKEQALYEMTADDEPADDEPADDEPADDEPADDKTEEEKSKHKTLYDKFIKKSPENAEVPVSFDSLKAEYLKKCNGYYDEELQLDVLLHKIKDVPKDAVKFVDHITKNTKKTNYEHLAKTYKEKLSKLSS